MSGAAPNQDVESSFTILIVDDDPAHLLLMTKHLAAEGYTTITANRGEEAIETIDQKRPDLVLLDIMMPGMSGMEALQIIQRRGFDTVTIMTTMVDEVATAVEAMKLGAYDYLVKPINFDQLNATLGRVKERITLMNEVERLRALQLEKFAMEEVVVASPPMKRVFELAEILGKADRATVLITGETGTGKEIVTRAIHLSSPRFDQPLVVVNCGAIPKELMEAELLGYAKGAFTGAAKEGKKGKVELAHRGTLFLDEIGELPPRAQTILLRILDDQPFYPVGSDREVRVDVRVIAATNRDLEASVSEGTFREDLFYRLNVAPIDIPPLRERPDDILPLAKSFLHEFNQKYAKAFQGFSKEAASLLEAYPWRGNVRELRNVVERLVLIKDDSEVKPEHLDFLKAAPSEMDSAFVLPEQGIDIETHFRDLILQALDKTQGNQSQAARLLGISLPTLRYRMEKYGLKD